MKTTYERGIERGIERDAALNAASSRANGGRPCGSWKPSSALCLPRSSNRLRRCRQNRWPNSSSIFSKRKPSRNFAWKTEAQGVRRRRGAGMLWGAGGMSRLLDRPTLTSQRRCLIESIAEQPERGRIGVGCCSNRQIQTGLRRMPPISKSQR